MTIQEKFAGLGIDNAPGQEALQKKEALDLRGEKLLGARVDFSHGDVDAHMPTPGSFDVFKEGFEEGGSQAYTPYRGRKKILDHVAASLSGFTGASIDPEENLILTPGTQGALFLAMGANIMPGDKVAIVEPDYFANRKMVEFFGGQMVPVVLEYENEGGRAGISLESLEEAPLDEASPFGRNFARSGGVAQAVAEALKEKGLDKEFQLKAVPCSGIEACEVALLKAKRGVLDGNFIEGMACDGGCVQGAGCLVRSPRNRMDVEGHAKQASGRSITDAVAGRELVPQDSLGEKVVPVPKSQPKAEAAAKTEGTARKA